MRGAKVDGRADATVGKASLSGGQRQRISIARALVKRPSILLMDEATSALDSTSETAVNRAVDAIVREQNITVILAAHRLSTIAQAEHVIVLEDGVVSEQGPYGVLVSRRALTLLCAGNRADVQSRREGSRFRSLMAAQLLVEQSDKGKGSVELLQQGR